jgi:hypothetical protein
LNTIELLKIINNTLLSAHSRVYYEYAPADSTYPYVVYELTNTFKNELRYDVTLTIDIWDLNKDSMPIETLVDNIDKSLDLLNNPTDIVLPTFFLENRQTVYDTNQNIRRRQLKYTIQTYFQ